MSLFKSVATFGGFTLLSRVTGFFRDMVLANFLGAGKVADAFFVAFKLPNLFRSLFAEGAFTSAFVPMLSAKMVADGQQKAILFASQAISVLACFLLLFTLVVEFFMAELILVLAPGFGSDPEKILIATQLSRITFPFLLFISIVSFQSGILNSLNKFAAPAAAPIILNFMMIIAAFAFTPFMPNPAYAIALGVSVAGVLEVLWLMFFLKRCDVVIRPQWNIVKLIHSSDIKVLFKRIAPGVLGAGVYQINMMVDTIIVSLVGTGAISWLYYANRLQQLPLGVIGAAISVALLPILSKNIKENNLQEANRLQERAVEYGALLSIPAAVALVVLAEPMVNILFQHGKFGALETEMTARAIIAYSIGLPVYVLVKAMTPNFFARGDTRTPVKYSVVVFAANVVFSLLLMKPLGHVGVATATSLAAFISFFQYKHGLKKRGYWKFSRALNWKIAKIILVSCLMGGAILAASYLLNSFYGDWLLLSIGPKLFIFSFLCFFGLATFLGLAKLFNVFNLSDFIRLIPKKGTKNA